MKKNKINRKKFIKQLFVKTGASVLTLGAGLFFINKNRVPRGKIIEEIKSFNIQGGKKFTIAKGSNKRLITRKAVEMAGGIKEYIKQGDKVLIKVNCAFARPDWMGATTSPEVTAEIIKMCYEAGASKVKVCDNPINDAKNCFEKSGIYKAAIKENGEILLPTNSDFKTVKVSNGIINNWEVFYTPLAWCDKLIGIPTIKTHNLCSASLAMKNWYGFIGGSRNRFHQNIHQVIYELADFIKPTFIILDGTRMLVRNGPTGGSADDVVPGNTVAFSTDQVAIDALGIQMLGINTNVEYLNIARDNGLGTTDYKSIPGFKEEFI